MLRLSSLPQRWILFPAVLIVWCIGICSGQEKTSPLFVSLVSDGKIYQTADEVRFSAFVKNRLGTDVQLISSIFTVEDLNGKVIFSQDHAFFEPNNLKGSVGSFSSANRPFRHIAIRDGDYRAVWIVNGISSNVVGFQIRSSKDNQASPALYIEPVSRINVSVHDMQISGYFRNDPAGVVRLMDLKSASILHIDGKPYPRMPTLWIGFSSLSPGASWGFMLSPLDYTHDISPGEHEIRFEMGGLRSNVIRIVWPDK
jgi:hypothetical protein